MYLSNFIFFSFFFFNDTATTEIYTLSLHDALPISEERDELNGLYECILCASCSTACPSSSRDRKSTRLNSSHSSISYAVFCLKKKKSNITTIDAVTHNVEHLRRPAALVPDVETRAD